MGGIVPDILIDITTPIIAPIVSAMVWLFSIDLWLE